MRKYLYTLMLFFPMMWALTSCSNDDDLPQVDISIDYSGATEVDGVFYVVAGNTFAIDALKVTPLDGYGKATLSTTAYYWNYQFVGSTIVEPFGMKFETEGMEPGNAVLQINTTVAQVDRSIGIAYFTLPVKIVESEGDIPGDDDQPDNGEIKPDVDMRTGVGPTI